MDHGTSTASTFTLESLIKTELPPLPGSVMRVSALVQDPNVSQRAIASTISLDPMLATRILRLANSPIYSLQRTITNLSDAVTAVGNNSISQCLMISGIGDSFGSRILRSDAGRDIWFNLLGTAMAASEMCHLAKLRGAEEAFTCGLLHDIGKLLMLKALPAVYQSVLQRGKEEGDLIGIEREMFGFDHAEVGALAAESWNLAAPVCNMIRWHHEPSKATEAIAITRIINLADQLVYLKSEDTDIGDLLLCEAAVGFDFTIEQFDEIWEKTSARIRDVINSFF